MELRQLRYFTAIVEHGSFGRAADQLFVAQSALSAQIKKLEDELGCRLLMRSAQGVALTPAGDRLLAHARLILQQVSAAVDEVRQSEPADVRGSVRLGLMSTVGRLMTIPLFDAMEIHLPHLTLHVVEALTTDLERMTAAGEIDLAVIFRASNDGAPVRQRVLREEKLYLVSPASGAPAAQRRAESRPVPFAEIGAFDLILPTVRFTLRKLLDEEAQKQRVALRLKYELDSLTQTLALINRTGCHSVMLLASFYKDWLAGNVCAREISGAAARPRTTLTWNPENTGTAVSAVADLLTDVAAQLNVSGQWPLTLPAAAAAA